jgi:beta-galactosidase
MEGRTLSSLKFKAGDSSEAPGAFFRGSFDLAEPGDTYFDLSAWKKGVVWVNGRNLGRYWSIGPQQRLFCPAPFLKKGKNEIIVLELLQKKSAPVPGFKTLQD